MMQQKGLTYLLAVGLIALGIWLFLENSSKRQLEQENQQLLTTLSYLSPLDTGLQAFLAGDTSNAAFYFTQAAAAKQDAAVVTSFQSFLADLNVARMKRDSLQQLSKRMQNATDKLSQLISQLQSDVVIKEFFIDSLNNYLLATEKAKLSLQLNQQQLETELNMAKNAYQQLTFKNAEGLTVRYFGRCEAGKAAGFGIGLFESKGIYEGQWLDNARHGAGKYTWSNGDSYEGEFREGARNGFGVYTFATGESYVGNWKNDLRDGKGKLLDSGGSVLLDGDWERDRFLRKPSKNATDSTQQQPTP
ncbi:MAG: hypothetical protein Q8J69_11340 [Sphingobacteriaceae bacterium]|nr:hypothetical protein [Sphingobacteriaceae bacterium]